MPTKYEVEKQAKGTGFVVVRRDGMFADEPVYRTKQDGMTMNRNDKPVPHVFATEREAQAHADKLRSANERGAATTQHVKEAVSRVVDRLKAQRERSRDDGRGL